MSDPNNKVFLEEAAELLEELESSLLELENLPDNVELIAKVFRALHTIKGSSGMFGYDEITKFTHDIENVYENIRSGRIRVNKEIIDLTLAAKDQICLMLEGPRGEGNADAEVINKVTESFGKIAVQFNVDNKGENKSKKKVRLTNAENYISGDSKQEVYYIKFKPGEDIYLSGTNPVLLLNELKELGDILINSHFEEVPLFEELNPEKIYVYWKIIIKTAKDLNAVKDVFIFVEDTCEIEIKKIDEGNAEEDLNYYYELMDFRNNGLKDESVGEIIDHGEKSGERKDQKRNSGNENSASQNLSSVRVNSDRLDLLVNLVGELVTVQARLSQTAGYKQDGEIISIAEDVERLIWELRDIALSIRMVPIESTFNKFKRLIRDLSNELGKEVELLTEGGETELDKNVIEKLNDPLVHIIRNCIDHGIENPEERISKNKLRTGSVFLSAVHSGTHVLIIISDDGRGLDKNKIYEKAFEKGLINKDADLTEKEIYNLIFQPGFSTAVEVTNVSGRGVGMDVVKSAIESLRGEVEVQSREGAGTTITLKLPLTLAIIEGLIVRIDKDFFVIPLSFVEECIELTPEIKKRSKGRNLISVRGEIVPYIVMRDTFVIHEKRPDIEQIVLISENDSKTGLVVDQIIGENQVVIKSLGSYYKNVATFSGASVLGDGTVALIMDIPKLISSQLKSEIFC